MYKLNEQQRQILSCVSLKAASEQLANVPKDEAELGAIGNAVIRLAKIIFLQHCEWLKQMAEEEVADKPTTTYGA